MHGVESDLLAMAKQEAAVFFCFVFVLFFCLFSDCPESCETYVLSTEYNKYRCQRPRRVGDTPNFKTPNEL